MANIASTGSNLPNINQTSVLDATTLSALKEGLDKLSGGIRVRLAKDGTTQDRGGASLLALGDRMSANLQTLNQATLNANDGIAITQVASAGLDDIHTDLQQLQKLVVASRSGTLSDTDRAALQEQAKQILQAIDQKVHSTRYNHIPLLASTKAILLQTGIDTNTQTTISLKDYSDAFTPVDLTSGSGVEAATASLKKEQEMVENAQALLAAKRSELVGSLNALSGWSPSLTAANGRIDSGSAAQTATDGIAALIRNNAALAFQVQANQSATRVQHLL